MGAYEALSDPRSGFPWRVRGDLVSRDWFPSITATSFSVLAEPGPEELVQQEGAETTRVPTPRPRDGRCSQSLRVRWRHQSRRDQIWREVTAPGYTAGSSRFLVPLLVPVTASCCRPSLTQSPFPSSAPPRSGAVVPAQPHTCPRSLADQSPAGIPGLGTRMFLTLSVVCPAAPLGVPGFLLRAAHRLGDHTQGGAAVWPWRLSRWQHT